MFFNVKTLYFKHLRAPNLVVLLIVDTLLLEPNSDLMNLDDLPPCHFIMEPCKVVPIIIMCFTMI